MDQYNFRIVNAGYLDKRSYVCFYLDGKRMREYCGNNLQMNIFPNRAKNVREKNSLLKRLRAELIKAVKADKYPVVTSVSSSDSAVPDKVIGGDNFATEPLLDMALSRKLNSGLSFSYLRNLRGVVDKFRSFLSETELKADIRTLSTKRVQDFLDSFRSSGCHYMNKRRELGVILSMISMEIERPLLMIQKTSTVKRKAKLHSIYEQDQLNKLLDFLQSREPNLYLCCLICYGCFLRPHQEIRNLRVSHIRKDCTEIHLSGTENKSGGIRIVYIPDYVRSVLLKTIDGLNDDHNIFTKRNYAYSMTYFHTRWQRLKKEMLDRSLLLPMQTIYSFRHSAAVSVYRKTKDLNIIQKLMGHSDMVVTLKYLRGLGEYNDERLRDFMPEL
jgi:integrase